MIQDASTDGYVVHTGPTEPVRADFARHNLQILPVEEAAARADWFFDVAAVLGRVRTPTGAAEVTRTGVHYYREIPCPVVSADDCEAKKIEGRFGTGDGFVRAWRMFFPGDPLKRKRVAQFGYGKIGFGVARTLRAQEASVTIVEVDPAARDRAREDGFAAVPGHPNQALKEVLAAADIVIAVTGIPGVLGRSLPETWLRANRPVLVNLGAEDEFGAQIGDDEILGGRGVPLNHHLSQPTQNRYVDPALAAHLLAFEALVTRDYPVGVHPLPAEMDRWILETWRESWEHSNP